VGFALTGLHVMTGQSDPAAGVLCMPMALFVEESRLEPTPGLLAAILITGLGATAVP
jgi:hypothetical protein